MDAFIYGGLRTPFGRHGGKLATIRPDDLAARVIDAVLETSPFRPDQVEDVILGCTNQAGEDSRNVARNAALASRLSTEVGGLTVNRLCASGLAAIADAARAIKCGEGDLFLAGGVESMTRAPFVMGKAETAYSRDVKIFDTTMGARFPNPTVTARYGADTMPETADNIAHAHDIGREVSDQFALGSQQRYAKAQASGFFADELLPIELPMPRSKGKSDKPEALLFMRDDEHPRADTTIEALARLKPLFANGVVTAGNASGINDGAAILTIGNKKIGDAAGIKPLARIIASAIVGVEPRVMGLGPVKAIDKALGRAGLSLDQMDLIEINEAFATQVLGCAKLLKLAFNDSRLNPHGGAIAIGHPLGASGARLALTAARYLQHSKGRYAVVSLCIGMGQGMAVVLEATA